MSAFKVYIDVSGETGYISKNASKPLYNEARDRPASGLQLRSFLDKSGERKGLCRHLQTPLLCRSSNDLDESDNSFICARTRTWSFAEFFCALGPCKTNECRFKFQVVMLRKLSILRVPDFCYFPQPLRLGHHRELRLVHCSRALFLFFVCLFVFLKKCTPF